MAIVSDPSAKFSGGKPGDRQKNKWPGFKLVTQAYDSCALCAAQHKSHRTIDPQCLENPRPEGAEFTLTANVASPFPAEPRQNRVHGPVQDGWQVETGSRSKRHGGRAPAWARCCARMRTRCMRLPMPAATRVCGRLARQLRRLRYWCGRQRAAQPLLIVVANARIVAEPYARAAAKRVAS